MSSNKYPKIERMDQLVEFTAEIADLRTGRARIFCEPEIIPPHANPED